MSSKEWRDNLLLACGEKNDLNKIVSIKNLTKTNFYFAHPTGDSLSETQFRFFVHVIKISWKKMQLRIWRLLLIVNKYLRCKCTQVVCFDSTFWIFIESSGQARRAERYDYELSPR